LTLKRVVIAFGVPPTAWVSELKGVGRLSIQILDCIAKEDGSVEHLVMFRTRDRDSAGMVRRMIKSSKLIEEAHLVNNSKGAEALLGIIKSSSCAVCRGLAGHCFIKRGEYLVNKDRVVWRFVAPDNVVREVLRSFEEKGIELNLLEWVEVKDPGSLNQTQVQLLMQALDAGYFDVPRRVSTHELAQNLGKTPATLSITLRRGLKKILTNYLVVNNA
jgi:predicted DNA binding protein